MDKIDNIYIDLKIQSIRQDIEILKKGQIYEIDSVLGVSKCSTVGLRLEEKFNELLAMMEADDTK